MRNQRVHGTVEADTAGEFSFDDVPEGVYSVEVEEQGYVKAVQADVRVVLRRVAAVEFALVRGSDEVLAEVVVSARATAGDPRATPNTVLLEREEIRRNPGSAGDVVRALDVLPGVVSTGEFSSFTVRGNGPRDNLILIDGIPFDKVAHFDESLGEQEAVDGGGRYSIFAPNIIGRAKFSPGGWRAAEGGRNGSLLELEIADGNPVSSTAGARVDIIGIEADYDGPSYVADNTSLLLSARAFDFSRLFEAIDEKDIGTQRLTDFIVKSVTDLNDDHRIELLAIQASEDSKRTVENALESENFEDVGLEDSKQDSTLLGVTWRWSPGEVAQLRNTLYYRNSDTTGAGEMPMGAAPQFVLEFEGKYVEELGGMNLFFLYADGRVVTPELTGTILPGVTRSSLLELARERGLQVEERRFTIDEWRDGVASGQITEVFACGTAAVVTPVGTLKWDGGSVASTVEEAGPLTLEIRQDLDPGTAGPEPGGEAGGNRRPDPLHLLEARRVVGRDPRQMPRGPGEPRVTRGHLPREPGRELGDRGLAVPEAGEDRPPGGIGEGREDQAEPVGGHRVLNQSAN